MKTSHSGTKTVAFWYRADVVLMRVAGRDFLVIALQNHRRENETGMFYESNRGGEWGQWAQKKQEKRLWFSRRKNF